MYIIFEMGIVGVSILYWSIWLVITILVTHDAPASVLGRLLLIYSVGGVLVYLSALFLFFYIPAQRHKRYEKEKAIHLAREENQKRFRKEKYLKRKYRTLTLKELIADTEINWEEKLILLESVHGYPLEKARKLLKTPPKSDK